jgi:1,4-alpha-glucan branching enzyme
MDRPAGYLCPILHAHLPYVRHPEHEDFLEERWFFEALTECYIPLLRVLEGLEDDGADYHLSLSLSPTLVSMLEDPYLQERYAAHLWKLVDLAEREIHRTRNDARLNFLAQHYHELFRNTIRWFDGICKRRVAQAFARIASAGRLELMTCAATHGFLPLLKVNPAMVRAQVFVARDYHEQVFGAPPAGMWLPECAYYPGLDEVLREAEIRFFIVDSHALLNASAAPRWGVHAPLYCPSGVAAFARDPESGKQVWSAEEGYPGHPDYREFYRDIGFDLDEEYLASVLVDGNIRGDTGIKYYRVTGREEKELYDPQSARERAALHAGDFLEKRQAQARARAGSMDRPPVIVSPYDAELFGHWWYEGPAWLDILLRKIHYDQDVVKTVTPAMFLAEFPTNQTSTPSASSWGEGGHYDFWLGEGTEWVYPLLHRAAERLQARLAESGQPSGDRGMRRRILQQAARELLLAQGSDWPFIMRAGTSPEYAARRIREHLARFSALCEMLERDQVDERALAAFEQIDPLFENLNLDHFAPAGTAAPAARNG